MKLAENYYSRKAMMSQSTAHYDNKFRRKNKTDELPSVPEKTTVEGQAVAENDGAYPDSVLIAIKREIAEINAKLNLIENLKAIEKPLQKRLKVLEKCLDNLVNLDPTPIITVDTDTPQKTLLNPVETIQITDTPVSNLEDFE